MEEGKGGNSSADTTTETQEQPEQQETKEAVNKKIDVLLKATGDAPIMKKKKWAVEGDKPVGSVADFIRKYIKLEPSESLVGLAYEEQAYYICAQCPMTDSMQIFLAPRSYSTHVGP